MDEASDFVIENGVLKEYIGTNMFLVIPNNVEVIADKAFADKGLSKIYIPKSVKRIEGTPFHRKELSGYYYIPDVYLENSREIYDSQNDNWTFAFSGNLWIDYPFMNVPGHFEKRFIQVTVKDNYSFDLFNKEFILNEDK